MTMEMVKKFYGQRVSCAVVAQITKGKQRFVSAKDAAYLFV